MDTSMLRKINREMDMQLGYVNEILDLIEECEKRRLLDDVNETELQQLREHCGDIALAAATAKKLVKNLEPACKAEEEDRAKDKDKDKEKKRKTSSAKKKEEAAKEAVNAPPEEGAADDDDDMSFLE